MKDYWGIIAFKAEEVEALNVVFVADIVGKKDFKDKTKTTVLSKVHGQTKRMVSRTIPLNENENRLVTRRSNFFH